LLIPLIDQSLTFNQTSSTPPQITFSNHTTQPMAQVSSDMFQLKALNSSTSANNTVIEAKVINDNNKAQAVNNEVPEVDQDVTVENTKTIDKVTVPPSSYSATSIDKPASEDGEIKLSPTAKLMQKQSSGGVLMANNKIRKLKRKNRTPLPTSAKKDHSEGDNLTKLMGRHVETNSACRETAKLIKVLHGVNISGPRPRSTSSSCSSSSSRSPSPSRPVAPPSPSSSAYEIPTPIESLYVPLPKKSSSFLREDDITANVTSVNDENDEEIEEIIASAPAQLSDHSKATDNAADEVLSEDTMVITCPISEIPSSASEDVVYGAQDTVSSTENLLNEVTQSEEVSDVSVQPTETNAERIAEVTVTPVTEPANDSPSTPSMSKNGMKKKAAKRERIAQVKIATKGHKAPIKVREQAAAKQLIKIPTVSAPEHDHSVDTLPEQFAEDAAIPAPDVSISVEPLATPNVAQDTPTKDDPAASAPEEVLEDALIFDHSSCGEHPATPGVDGDIVIVDEPVTASSTIEPVPADGVSEVSAIIEATVNSELSVLELASVVAKDDVQTPILPTFFALPNGTGEDFSTRQLQEKMVALQVTPFVEPPQQKNKLSSKEKEVLQQAATAKSPSAEPVPEETIAKETIAEEAILADCDIDELIHEQPVVEEPEDILSTVEIWKDNSIESFLALPNGSVEDIATHQLREDMVARHVPALMEPLRVLTKKDKKALKQAAASTSLLNQSLVDETAPEDVSIEESTASEEPHEATVVPYTSTTVKQELKDVDNNKPSSSSEVTPGSSPNAVDHSRRDSYGSITSMSTLTLDDLERQEHAARNTYIGNYSVEDLIEKLDYNLENGSTTKDAICQAFSALSAGEFEIMQGRPAENIANESTSLSAQRKTKVGKISLYNFLRPIIFDDDGFTTVGAVIKAFSIAAASDRKVSFKLLRALELAAESSS
jgi:hypothetical protein